MTASCGRRTPRRPSSTTARDGILERHRLKVAGYIEMGFKLGRNVTIGGFSGRFSDRTWREIDEQLVASRDDRFDKVPSHTHRRGCCGRSASEVEAARVRQVVLDTAGTGLNHAAGDRCLVYPEQDGAIVERTLRALGARGDEPIKLDVAWQDRMETLGDPRTELPVGDLLRRGELRPVGRATAKTLLDLCASERLEEIIEARAEDQWELPDVLAMLAERGWDPGVLLTGEPGDRPACVASYRRWLRGCTRCPRTRRNTETSCTSRSDRSATGRVTATPRCTAPGPGS